MSKYLFNWSGGYPFCITEPSANRFFYLRKEFGINAKKWIITYSIKDRASCYSLVKDKKYLYEVSKKYLNMKFMTKLFSESEKIRKNTGVFPKNYLKLISTLKTIIS
jgi:hypothetical protein